MEWVDTDGPFSRPAIDNEVPDFAQTLASVEHLEMRHYQCPASEAANGLQKSEAVS